MELTWFQLKGGGWCNLHKLDISHQSMANVKGVYIIWLVNKGVKKVLRVGCGLITEVLAKEKVDLAIQAFAHMGINVTFAEVPPNRINNAFSYLLRELNPSMQIDETDAAPMKINIPI